MRGPRFWLWALGATLSTTGAQAGDSSVRLEYRAPAAGCPGDAAFRSEVEQRLDHARLAETKELARTYRIDIDADGERFVARLEFTDADGAQASRELTAPTCDEAARAIALVAALAIEERVVKEEEAARAAPSPPDVPKPEQAPLLQSTPRATPPRPSARPPRFGVIAELGVEHGFAPRTAPRVSAAFESSFGELALRAGLAWASTGPVDVDGGSATFALYTLRLQGCPWRLSLTDSVALRPCAGFDAGFVHAAGRRSARIVDPKSTTELWLAPQAIGRLEWSPDPSLGLELQGALGAPLTRPEFFLEKPEFTVHSVPALSWGAGASVIGRF